ncbi:hypothetical protein J31TS3_47350 [Paenibacillus lactis]|nr:hypothetical protein J31TS3_47350 [Paenibacillus lactis]
MGFSEFKGERSAFRMPPQAEYEGFPLSAKSIPIPVEADAAEEVAAPRESERAMEAGGVGGRAGNIFAVLWHGVSFSIAVEFGKFGTNNP